MNRSFNPVQAIAAPTSSQGLEASHGEMKLFIVSRQFLAFTVPENTIVHIFGGLEKGPLVCEHDG